MPFVVIQRVTPVCQRQLSYLLPLKSIRSHFPGLYTSCKKGASSRILYCVHSTQYSDLVLEMSIHTYNNNDKLSQSATVLGANGFAHLQKQFKFTRQVASRAYRLTPRNGEHQKRNADRLQRPAKQQMIRFICKYNELLSTWRLCRPNVRGIDHKTTSPIAL